MRFKEFQTKLYEKLRCLCHKGIKICVFHGLSIMYLYNKI